MNIVLRNPWTKKDFIYEGWQTKLTINHPLYFDLVKAYEENIGDHAMFLYNKLQFYNYIAYTVLDDDQEPIRVKLCIGDIVDMEEEIEGTGYARIKAIVRHQANSNLFYAFFILDWFQATQSLDSILNCPYYTLHEFEKTPWCCIYPITFINHNSCLHFVHACKSTCNNVYDMKNRQYIRNDFFYHSI